MAQRSNCACLLPADRGGDSVQHGHCPTRLHGRHYANQDPGRRGAGCCLRRWIGRLQGNHSPLYLNEDQLSYCYLDISPPSFLWHLITDIAPSWYLTYDNWPDDTSPLSEHVAVLGLTLTFSLCYLTPWQLSTFLHYSCTTDFPWSHSHQLLLPEISHRHISSWTHFLLDILSFGHNTMSPIYIQQHWAIETNLDEVYD